MIYLIKSHEPIPYNLINTQDREALFNETLKPLIEENYRLRELGTLPDEWYWADELAAGWGLFVNAA